MEEREGKGKERRREKEGGGEEGVEEKEEGRRTHSLLVEDLFTLFVVLGSNPSRTK